MSSPTICVRLFIMTTYNFSSPVMQSCYKMQKLINVIYYSCRIKDKIHVIILIAASKVLETV